MVSGHGRPADKVISKCFRPMRAKAPTLLLQILLSRLISHQIRYFGVKVTDLSSGAKLFRLSGWLMKDPPGMATQDPDRITPSERRPPSPPNFGLH
jgi:hypothetical protein